MARGGPGRAALRSPRARLAAALRPLTDEGSIRSVTLRAAREALSGSSCRWLRRSSDVYESVRLEAAEGGAEVGEPEPLVIGSCAAFSEAEGAGGLFVVEDAASDPRLDPRDRKALSGLGVRSLVAAPLPEAGPPEEVLLVTDAAAGPWSEDALLTLEDIAERGGWALRRAREAAALSRDAERQRTVLEALETGFCIFELIFDANGEPIDYRFLETNPAFEKHTGLVDAVGRTARELVPELEQHWVDAYAQVALTGSPARFTLASAAMGRWFEVSASRVGAPAEHKVALLFVDVTRRSEAEDALRRAHALIEGITSGTEDLIAAIDREFRLTYFNEPYRREYRALWGRDPEVGKHLFAALDAWPEEKAKAEPAWRRALRGESARVEETFGPSPERQVTYDQHFSPVRDADGQVVGAAQILRDVTERVRTARALRESEELAREVVSSITDAFVALDAEWSIEFLNGRAAELVRPLHPEADALLGRDYWEAFPDTLGTEIESSIRRAMTSRKMIAFETFYPPLESWLEVRAYPSSRGGLSLYFLDVTSRKRSEERLRHNEKELREADRRKDAYLAMLGHELRNPLAAVSGAVEVLRRIGPADARVSRAVEVLARQSRHMTGLIDGLLEVSRIARDKIELALEVLDAKEIVRGVLEDRSEEIEERGIEVVTFLPSGPVGMKADRVRLTQIIDNLLSNALKFTSAPGRVSVGLAVEGSQVVLRVRDNGVGVDPSKLLQIFEPFHQVEQSVDRALGGLGLGLAVVKGLVELHGGTIEAISEGVGTGVEMTARMPRGHLGDEPLPWRGRRAPARGRRLRILIIEDSPDAAEMLDALLTDRGYVVRVAKSGAEGLALLREFSPSVVLCDIGLPQMTGYEVARAIREIPELAGLRLIALSGYGQIEDRRRSRDAGFDAHLAKPATIEAIEDAMAGSIPVASQGAGGA